MLPKNTSWSKSLGNYIFGFDFFISYAHADAQHYAVDLALRLDEQGFECFVDTEDYAAGDDWRAAGRIALFNCRRPERMP